MEDCDWVVMAVPVAAMAEVAAQLEPVSRFGLIWTCKGMDPDSGRLPGEILDGRPGFGSAARRPVGAFFPRTTSRQGCRRPRSWQQQTQGSPRRRPRCFTMVPFRIYPGTDPVGVQLGGAVKNVLAIAAGIAHGLRLGDSARAALITRGNQ